MSIRGVCELALKLRWALERPASEKWRVEPRSEPDSGNPTVRDRRGALGNVVYGGTRIPPHNRKSACRKLSTYGCAHPNSIPTTACGV